MLQVTVCLPGKIISVDNGNITIEMPTIECPIVNPEAATMLTKKLSDFDADVLLERIGHFAITESFRARIGLCGLVQTRPVATSDNPKGWEAV